MAITRTTAVGLLAVALLCLNLGLHRLERLDHLVKKFQHKCEIHEEWSNGKIDLLTSTDFKQCSLNDLRALSRKHLAFESDLAAHQDRVEQIAAIAQELNVLGYDQIAAVNQRCQNICNEWDQLGDATHKRRVALSEAERIVERVDSLFLEYAKKAAPYLNSSAVKHAAGKLELVIRSVRFSFVRATRSMQVLLCMSDSFGGMVWFEKHM